MDCTLNGRSLPRGGSGFKCCNQSPIATLETLPSGCSLTIAHTLYSLEALSLRVINSSSGFFHSPTSCLIASFLFHKQRLSLDLWILAAPVVVEIVIVWAAQPSPQAGLLRGLSSPHTVSVVLYLTLCLGKRVKGNDGEYLKIK